MNVLSLNKKKFLHIIGFISIIVIIWFITPLLIFKSQSSIKNCHLRVFFIFLFIIKHIIISFCIKKYKDFKNKKILDSLIKDQNIDNKEDVKDLKRDITSLFKSLKKAYEQEYNEKIQLNKIPWFLILGNSQVGKTQFILNSGYHFPDLEYLNPISSENLGHATGYKWWFSKEATLLSVNSSVTNSDSWHEVLKALKYGRQRIPINGLIIVEPLMDLLMINEAQRLAYCDTLKKNIRSLHKDLGISFPIYFVFTKCDQISGFSNFFKNIFKDQQDQIWGINFEKNNIKNYLSHFMHEFDQFVQNLNNLMPWILNKTTKYPEEKQRIYLFPHQMQLFKSPLMSLIKNIVGDSYKEKLQLQGIYFASSEQKGKSYDMYSSASAHNLGFQSLLTFDQNQSSQQYFIQDLFKYFIQVGLSLSEYGKRRKILYQWSKGFLYTSLISLLLFNGWSLTQNYYFYRRNLHQVDVYLNESKEKLKIFSQKYNFEDVISAFMPLFKALNLYQKSAYSWTNNFQLYPPYNIEKELQELFEQQAGKVFLPLIKNSLADSIRKNWNTPEELEKFLKAYILLARVQERTKGSIQTIMKHDWQKTYPHQVERLEFILNYALKSHESVTLDEQFLKRVKQKISREDPVLRAYEELKLKGQEHFPAPFLPATYFGKSFYPTFDPSKINYEIPFIYTLEGFKNFVVKEIPVIFQRIRQEDKEIGLNLESATQDVENQYLEELFQLYAQDYIIYWENFLNEIEIIGSLFLKEYIEDLDLFAGKQSFLKKLMTLVSMNTDANILPSLINEHFLSLNKVNVSPSKEEKSQLELILNALLNLSNYLNSFSKVPFTDNKVLFKEVMEIYSLDKNTTPLQLLKNQADQVPQPLKNWLIEIADHSWFLLTQGSKEYFDQIKNKELLNTFKDKCLDKYPFNKNSNQDTKIADFTSFFKSQGLLEQFFTTYIKPFIEENGQDLHWKSLKGQKLEISENILNMFSMIFKIQEVFFANKTNKPSFEFLVEPLSLSPNTKIVKIEWGNKIIQYRHEALQSYVLQWPGELGHQDCKITFQDFNDHIEELSFTGPWSLLKLLDQNNIKTVTEDKKLQVQIDHKNFKLILEIMLPDNFQRGDFEMIREKSS